MVGHRRKHPDRLPLAVSDEDSKKQRDSTQAAEFDKRIVDMLGLFDTVSDFICDVLAHISVITYSLYAIRCWLVCDM